jgi:hypothetical protein
VNKISALRPLRFAELKVESLEAVRSSHISEGETEKSLIARTYIRVRLVINGRTKQQHTEITDALLSQAHAFHQVSHCRGSQQASIKGASKYMYAASMLMSENYQITIQIDHTSQLCN